MKGFLIALVVLAAAVLLDLVLGEPFWKSPLPLHPTVLVNKLIKRIFPFFKSEKSKIEKINGVLLAVIVISITTLAAYLILYAASMLSILLYILIAAFILKFTICIKLETDMANMAAEYVREGNLSKGRGIAALFSRRETANLNGSQIVSAIIESIAENLADFKLSPLFYYGFFGVPGAVAYKIINTLDGTVGFKDEKHVNIGWFSAMADTVANFLISRLSALLIVLAAFFTRENYRNAWRIMLRDYRKVPSINHGWPMAAMAGALDVQLEKPGYYVIGEAKRELSPHNIKKALKIRNTAIILFIILIELPILLLVNAFRVI